MDNLFGYKLHNKLLSKNVLVFYMLSQVSDSVFNNTKHNFFDFSGTNIHSNLYQLSRDIQEFYEEF